MKHKGNGDYYRQLLRNELYAVYKREVWEGIGGRIGEIFNRIVNYPTSRFFVTEERAYIVIASMLNGRSIEGFSSSRREMYYEIFKRVKAYFSVNSGSSLKQALRHVLKQQAPKFYITPSSAQVIIHQIKRNK